MGFIYCAACSTGNNRGIRISLHLNLNIAASYFLKIRHGYGADSMCISRHLALKPASDIRDGISCLEIPYGIIDKAHYALPYFLSHAA
jgi:hypothetical protein